MKATFAPVLFLAIAAAGAPAVVSVQTSQVTEVSPGQSRETQISVSVAKGYHLQANPASEDYLIATRLELKPVNDITIGKLKYPPGTPYRLSGADKDLKTYEGDFDIGVSLKVSQSASRGEHVLQGRLHYQACNSKVCLSPTSVPITLTVAVLPAKAKPPLTPKR
jgi:uncharacterized protein